MIGQFFVAAGGPLKQGDILIAPVARVAAGDYFVPDRWDRLDQDEHRVDRSRLDGDDIAVFSGRELVMVTSHDCHHDKEWNVSRSRLIKQGHAPEDAEAIAEADDTLDRHFHASPLIPFDDFPANERGNYRAGKVTGYFPLPVPPDDAFPECVVDLTYRCTIDKKAIKNRHWCLSEEARDTLRYSIARFDSFRSVEVSETIERAIGRTIVDVAVETSAELVVVLTLDDDSELRLVRPPTEPAPGGRTEM